MLRLPKSSPQQTIRAEPNAVGHPNTRGISVLEQLKICLYQNIQLQAQLEAFLEQLEQALKRNADEQAKAEILSKNKIRYPKSSIMGLMKPKARIPYFVDMNLKCPPPNKDAEEMKDKLSEVFINPATWLKNDDKKLIVGVKQKNLERLSRPIQQRMLSSGMTIDELKELEAQITELKTKNVHQLLVHSDDLDWNTIAYEQFNCEHSAYDCYLRYKNFLQPSINHKEWTPNEVWRLNELAKKHNQYNWEEVAIELNTGRTAVQCLRCYKTSSHLLSKNQWTLEEDKKLKKAVTLYGQNWGLVATYIGTRTSQQCSGRYYSGVLEFFSTPALCSGRWSDEENERLKKAIKLYGSNGHVWTAVSKFVGTRNSTQCRERYRNVVAGQHLIRPWTENETKKLMDYCNEKLKDGIVVRWCDIARELDRRDDACRRKWLTLSSLEEKLEMKKLSIKHKQQHMGGGHTSKKRHTCKVAIGDNNEEEISVSVQEELEQYKTRILTKRVMKPRPRPPSNKKKRKGRGKGKGKSSDPKDNTVPAQQAESAPTLITIELVQSTSTGPTTNTGPELNQPAGPTAQHFTPGGPPLQPISIPFIDLAQSPPFPLPHVQLPPFGVPGVSHNPGPFPPAVDPIPPSVPFSHSTSSQFQPLPSQLGPSFRPCPPSPNPPLRRSTRIRARIAPPPTASSSFLSVSLPPPSPVMSSSCSSASNSSVPSPVAIEEVVTTTSDNENADFILIEDEDDD